MSSFETKTRQQMASHDQRIRKLEQSKNGDFVVLDSIEEYNSLVENGLIEKDDIYVVKEK